MTCIVAIRDKNKIYMGADSLASDRFGKYTRKDKKVFINKNMIFGFTSSFRMGQILEHSFDPPEQKHNEKDFKYLVDSFIPALIETYKSKAYLKNGDGQASGGEFIIGYKKQIYKIENDFQVGIPTNNYVACGSGEYHAIGSLYTSGKFNLTPKERIKLAINAASEYVVSVGGPIHILSMEW